MSLISEALKKARQEVARQEADKLAGAPPALPYHMPVQRAERPAWLAALLGGFVGAAIVTAALLWVYRPGTQRPAVPTSLAAASPAAPTAPTPAPVVPAAPSPTSPSSPSRLAATALPGAPAAATPLRTAPLAGATATITAVSLPAGIALATPEPEPAVERVPASASPSAAAATATASRGTAGPEAPAAEQVEPGGKRKSGLAGDSPPYRVRLADGQELVLSGIAAGEGVPVALVNRRAVGVGESVDGWQIVRIEPKRVELVRDGETVVLSLR